MEAPYRRIANEIRDRIARGELRPGDRVPSVRTITQTWDVAMATATKVIVELKHEGLVHTRPGSGTVVADQEKWSRRGARPDASPHVDADGAVDPSTAVDTRTAAHVDAQNRAESDAGAAAGMRTAVDAGLATATVDDRADDRAGSGAGAGAGTGDGGAGGGGGGGGDGGRSGDIGVAASGGAVDVGLAGADEDVPGGPGGAVGTASGAGAVDGPGDGAGRVDVPSDVGDGTGLVSAVGAVGGSADGAGRGSGAGGGAGARGGLGAVTGGAGQAVDLSRDRVVRAAIDIADADGLAMLTMRRVASALGASTMSLYRHVVGKEDLVLLMADEVFGEEAFPEPPVHWRARLIMAGRMMWAVFRRHPWAAEVLSMTRPQLLPNLLDYAEWTLSALRGLGMGLDDTMYAYLSIVGHVRGTALNIQAEQQAEQDTGMTSDEWMDTQEQELSSISGSGRYPNLQHVTSQQFDYNLDAVFEYGLQRMLDGIEVRVRELARSAKGGGAP